MKSNWNLFQKGMRLLVFANLPTKSFQFYFFLKTKIWYANVTKLDSISCKIFELVALLIAKKKQF